MRPATIAVDRCPVCEASVVAVKAYRDPAAPEKVIVLHGVTRHVVPQWAFDKMRLPS